jgi:hypothetical protein
LEVIGVTNVFHLGQVQVGLDEPIRICQGSFFELNSLEVNVKEEGQIDGEPFALTGKLKIELQ